MIDDTLLEAEEKMDKAVTVAQEDFSNIRTGRVHPAVFSKITAEYYGTQTPLDQLASFHIPEPRMITVQPFDKGSLGAIEKAIRNSDLGREPVQRRRAHPGGLPRADRGAPARVHQDRPLQGRGQPRRHPQHQAPRQGRARQDGQERRGRRGRRRRAERELQELTDTYIAKIDELLKHKEAELLEV